MTIFNLIEYSDNYSDTSGSLWGFKRDEITNNANVTNDDNAPSFKYKVNLITNTEADGTKKGVKIAAPLKYLSNFCKSLEIPLINCRVELSLRWIENCVLTTAEIGANANATGADGATFTVTDAKLHVPVVTLSTEDNVKLSKLLSEGFNRCIYWNEYKVIDNKIVVITAVNEEKHIRELFDSSCQGVNRLFVLAYENTEGDNQVSVNSFKKHFLPRVKIGNYNIKVDRRNLCDQSINDSIKQYDEVRKSINRTRWWLQNWLLVAFSLFWKKYRLIGADLSKQKASDADSRAIQKIIFTGKLKLTVANTKVIIFYIFEEPKETVLQFSKETAKLL